MDSASVDLEELFRLNAQHEVETSALGMASLAALVAKAFHLGVRGEGRDAFLIALDQDADYASPHFGWFKKRMSRFVYVDRLIVARAMRRRGVARQLYEELFERCLAEGHDYVACEVNIYPPNHASDALHAALGFIEVGRGVSGDQQKTVRYVGKCLRATNES